MRRLTPLAAVVAATILTGCADVRVYEQSMEPTIRSGDLVTLDEHAYDGADPQPGDIVSLRAPRGAEEDRCGVAPRSGSPCPRPTAELADELQLVKRVVAGPGDRVAIGRAGAAIVNGRRLEEPYALPCPGTCALPVAVRVPPGHWFVLGDNRPYSGDSRHWGPVPRRALEGRVAPAEELG